MNPFALYFASGESLYPGAILLLVAIAASPLLRAKWPALMRNLLAWIGLAMMLLACAPFAWWLYAAFGLAFLAWFIAWNKAANSRFHPRHRIATSVCLALLVITSASHELAYRAKPVIGGPIPKRLTVIGDSISAGIGGGIEPWPEVFENQTGIPVENLARPGIGVAEAVGLAKKMSSADSLVLIEIGGNDLLANAPANDFERDLEALLKEVERPGNKVVMFELPLLPHKIAFGRIQRRLAAQYGVTLIPKRYFIDVLGSTGTTSDGLHLSAAGAEKMSDFVASCWICRIPKSIEFPSTRGIDLTYSICYAQ